MDAIYARPELLYAGLVLLVVLIPSARYRALGAAGLGLVLLAAGSDRVAGPSSGTTFAAVNEVMLLLGGLVVVVARVAGFRRGPGSPPTPASPQFPGPVSQPLFLAGLVLAAAAPHLLLVELGIALMLLAAVRTTLRTGRLRWLVVLVVGGGMLGTGLVLATTILGPMGGEMAALQNGPFSPAAERMLIMLLGAGTLMLAGLPPVRRAPWGLWLAPLAAIVMWRVALVALPNGVLEWQPLAMVLLALAGASAAFARRWPVLAAAAGLASLWSGVPSGVPAGMLLVLWGWLLELADGWSRIPRPPERWAGLLLLVPALATLPALEAGLGAQVLVSVAFVVAVVTAVLGEFVRRSRGAHPPLY